jgi:predicted DNA-binding antitoxin AbrB/MazE fold protein
MAITVEAVYEGGVLKPVEPLPSLREGQRVEVTIVADRKGWAARTAGMLGWKGTHEELQAILDDVDDLYGTPDDWFPHLKPKEQP